VVKKIFILVSIFLAGAITPANAKTQGPDILLGKYICIAKMIGKVAFIDCDDTYTANKKVGANYYLVRDKKDKNWLMKCGYDKKRKQLVNCEIIDRNKK
jgi:hypothetical protein